ncbi:hypothetical protein [Ornithinimicrobium kibberense]|uniref:hypothetical protein n=1 Tax=Ornithinimicrobium kibberense TaxID=282060 RepID=UPI00361BDEF7
MTDLLGLGGRPPWHRTVRRHHLPRGETGAALLDGLPRSGWDGRLVPWQRAASGRARCLAVRRRRSRTPHSPGWPRPRTSSTRRSRHWPAATRTGPAGWPHRRRRVPSTSTRRSGRARGRRTTPSSSGSRTWSRTGRRATTPGSARWQTSWDGCPDVSSTSCVTWRPSSTRTPAY